jgi:maleylacetoacetate isomerase/maleylpyruvate isomerase
MKLYTYFRSSASFRVRIALGLKGLAYDSLPVHLSKNEQFAPSFDEVSPQHLVPALVDVNQTLTQSLAIIEYLDETHPLPPLLPTGAAARARVRSLALDIACEVHPLNNLRVLRYLKKDLAVSDEAKDAWYHHWVKIGLGALERRLVNDAATGRFCHGDEPGLADCVLVPQVFNAQRFKVDLAPMPTVMRIVDACMALPAFEAAQPSRCPDAEA